VQIEYREVNISTPRVVSATITCCAVCTARVVAHAPRMSLCAPRLRLKEFNGISVVNVNSKYGHINLWNVEASTRFLVSRTVAPPPPPPQLPVRRAGTVARRFSRKRQSHQSRRRDTRTRRAPPRTRRPVVPDRRFPSTAGMDSDNVNARVSGALCGRRSEGTAFVSSAAGRSRHTSGIRKTPKKRSLWPLVACPGVRASCPSPLRGIQTDIPCMWDAVREERRALPRTRIPADFQDYKKSSARACKVEGVAAEARPVAR
jgi:hypothetical protein